jgi:hypothetical protein
LAVGQRESVTPTDGQAVGRQVPFGGVLVEQPELVMVI